MSGSERRIERRAAAKVMPALLLTCTWLMPARRYSTGSSTVMMFFDSSLRMLRVAYSVVDLPEPGRPGDEDRAVGLAVRLLEALHRGVEEAEVGEVQDGRSTCRGCA